MREFIYCFTVEDKEKLIKDGNTFLKEEIVDDKKAFMFLKALNNNVNQYAKSNNFVFTNSMIF